MNKPYSKEEILKILHSITDLSTKDGELDVWQEGDNHFSSINSFAPGSFTRELLELIQLHMAKGVKPTEIGEDEEDFDLNLN